MPRLAEDRHHPAIRRRAEPGRLDDGERRVTTDERQRRDPLVRCGERRGRRLADVDRRSREIRADRGVTDRFVASRRLGQRRHTQLTVEDRDARPVLAQRGGPVAARRQQLHAPDMGTLVERVEVDASSGGRRRGGHVTGRRRLDDESVQEVGDRPLDPHRPGRPPVVELRAVAQREAGEEGAAGKIGGRSEVADDPRSGRSLQLDEVDGRALTDDVDPRPIDPQQRVAHGASHHRQRPSQGAACRGVVGVGPQQGRQLVAGVRPAVGREDHEDRDRLARVDVQRRPVDEDLRCPEQPDLQPPVRVVTGRHGRNDTTGEAGPLSFPEDGRDPEIGRRNVPRTLRFDDGCTNREHRGARCRSRVTPSPVVRPPPHPSAEGNTSSCWPRSSSGSSCRWRSTSSSRSIPSLPTRRSGRPSGSSLPSARSARPA